jgi:hypothetical protein
MSASAYRRAVTVDAGWFAGTVARRVERQDPGEADEDEERDHHPSEVAAPRVDLSARKSGRRRASSSLFASFAALCHSITVAATGG